MFHGVSKINLDDKGRISIPVKLRDSLVDANGHPVFVTVDPQEPCLWVLPYEEWQTIAKKVAGLPSFSRPAMILKRTLIGNAEECELDRSGRIRLNDNLREYAALEKRVCLVGQDNKFEIWNEEILAQKRREWSTEGIQLDNLPVEMESLSL